MFKKCAKFQTEYLRSKVCELFEDANNFYKVFFLVPQ